MVTRLPLPEMAYRHVDNEIALPGGGTRSIFQTVEDLWRHASKGMGHLLVKAVTDHYMENYVNALTELARTTGGK